MSEPLASEPQAVPLPYPVPIHFDGSWVSMLSFIDSEIEAGRGPLLSGFVERAVTVEYGVTFRKVLQLYVKKVSTGNLK